MSKGISDQAGARKLARFKEKFRAYPDKGAKVEIETNENGFWNLVL